VALPSTNIGVDKGNKRVKGYMMRVEATYRVLWLLFLTFVILKVLTVAIGLVAIQYNII